MGISLPWIVRAGWDGSPLPLPGAEGDKSLRISLPGSSVLAGTVPPSLPWSGGGRNSENFITWIVRVGWDDSLLPLPGAEGDETVGISLPGSSVLAGTVPPYPSLVRRETRQ